MRPTINKIQYRIWLPRHIFLKIVHKDKQLSNTSPLYLLLQKIPNVFEVDYDYRFDSYIFFTIPPNRPSVLRKVKKTIMDYYAKD